MACGGQGGLPNQGGLPPAQQAPQAPPKMLEAVPTVCLRMTNMLNEEMLKDDEEYAEIKEDIAEELQNYGTVAGVEIPRSGVGYLCAFVKFCEPSNPSAALCLRQPATVDNVVCGFVASVDEAKKAKEVVEKRTFDGKQIGAEYFEPDKFDAKQFGIV